MGLLRNDGKYVILGSIVIMLIVLKGERKLLLYWGVVIAITFGLFFNVLMPALHITSASRREALSVPFQQTARYFRDYENEVTEEEYSVVAAVLKPELLKEKYDPNLSDPVKATFLETATKEDLWAYFKVWFQMGLKHPGAYIQATLNNYYVYFYPGTTLAQKYSYNWSESCMAIANEALQEIGCSFHYPEIFNGVRTTYEAIRESVFEIPLLSLLKCPAAYVWALILLAFYFVKEKAWKALALMAPLALSVGICFLGPCNGEYFRYLYGVSVCLPVMAILTLWLCGNANMYQ